MLSNNSGEESSTTSELVTTNLADGDVEKVADELTEKAKSTAGATPAQVLSVKNALTAGGDLATILQSPSDDPTKQGLKTAGAVLSLMSTLAIAIPVEPVAAAASIISAILGSILTGLGAETPKAAPPPPTLAQIGKVVRIEMKSVLKEYSSDQMLLDMQTWTQRVEHLITVVQSFSEYTIESIQEGKAFNQMKERLENEVLGDFESGSSSVTYSLSNTFLALQQTAAKMSSNEHSVSMEGNPFNAQCGQKWTSPDRGGIRNTLIEDKEHLGKMGPIYLNLVVQFFGLKHVLDYQFSRFEDHACEVTTTQLEDDAVASQSLADERPPGRALLGSSGPAADCQKALESLREIRKRVNDDLQIEKVMREWNAVGIFLKGLSNPQTCPNFIRWNSKSQFDCNPTEAKNQECSPQCDDCQTFNNGPKQWTNSRPWFLGGPQTFWTVCYKCMYCASGECRSLFDDFTTSH